MRRNSGWKRITNRISSIERTCSKSQARAFIFSQGAAIATVTINSSPTSICAARVPLISESKRLKIKATSRISTSETSEKGRNPNKRKSTNSSSNITRLLPSLLPRLIARPATSGPHRGPATDARHSLPQALQRRGYPRDSPQRKVPASSR